MKKLLVILLLSAGLPLSGVQAPQIPALTVKGMATLMKPADQLQLSLGVVTQNRTAEAALKENSSKMNNLILGLQKAGLKEGEYKTGRFSIRPLHSERPKNAPVDWKPEIVGYEATNSLEVTSDKVKTAGSLIDAAAQAGANSIDNIRFSLKDERPFRKEAIQLATQNAMADAEALGDAAGVTLTRILSLSLDDAQTVAPFPRAMMTKSFTESVPIEAGDVEVRASVTVQYEIRN